MNFTTQYDLAIKICTREWLPDWDWQWLKAQACAESALNPKAVSGVGAKGLFQHMPDTWTDCAIKLRFPLTASPFDPQYSIPAGIYYMAVMRNSWAAPRSEDDRRKLAQASYNAGFGNILKAQKLAGGAADWATISLKLPRVTGPQNAKQTTDYVTRIAGFYWQFKNEAA
jgi:membrane-bound lytic murein transglycosylase MltF